MNMREASVSKALMLAGNMPLTPEDKLYGNLPYRYAKELYLNTLFNALSEIEWRSARKWFALAETRRHVLREAGLFYYEIPAECVKPVRVPRGDFRQDGSFIVCECPSQRLWGVFHRRSKSFFMKALASQDGRDASAYIERPKDAEAQEDPRLFIRRARTAEEEKAVFENNDDFPEWEHTEYEPQFWKYFEYRLAADLSMKLKGDSALYSTLIQAADKFGEEAIQSSRDAAQNDRGEYRSWAQKCGLRTWDEEDYREGDIRGRVWGLRTGSI